MRRTWLAVVAVAWASGCYATTEVPATQIASIARPLSAPRKVGGSAKLGPKTEIRAWLADGSVTPWLSAGGLAVAKEGLVSGRRHPLAAASEATIAAAGEGAAEMLAAIAPPGGERPGSRMVSSFVLTVADRRVLLPWIAAYAAGAKTMRQPLGWVSFRSRATGGRPTGSRVASSSPLRRRSSQSSRSPKVFPGVTSSGSRCTTSSRSAPRARSSGCRSRCRSCSWGRWPPWRRSPTGRIRRLGSTSSSRPPR